MKQKTLLCAIPDTRGCSRSLKHVAVQRKRSDRQLRLSFPFNYFDILSGLTQTGLTIATARMENAFEIEETGVWKRGIYGKKKGDMDTVKGWKQRSRSEVEACNTKSEKCVAFCWQEISGHSRPHARFCHIIPLYYRITQNINPSLGSLRSCTPRDGAFFMLEKEPGGGPGFTLAACRSQSCGLIVDVQHKMYTRNSREGVGEKKRHKRKHFSHFLQVLK